MSRQFCKTLHFRIFALQGPILSTALLDGNIPYLQRAQQILTFVVQYYVHSLPRTESNPVVVPKTLAIPLMAVSKALGTAPILTYTNTVLWNMRPKDPSRPMASDNLTCERLFSGTRDEEAFYKTSALVELRAAELLGIIIEYQTMPVIDDQVSLVKIAKMLDRAAAIVVDMSDILEAVKIECDPRVFYDSIRPWFDGSNPSTAGMGWEFEGVPDSDKLDLGGASAGSVTSSKAE